MNRIAKIGAFGEALFSPKIHIYTSFHAFHPVVFEVKRVMNAFIVPYFFI